MIIIIPIGGIEQPFIEWYRKMYFDCKFIKGNDLLKK